MKERVADLKDLGRQILHFLLGKNPWPRLIWKKSASSSPASWRPPTWAAWIRRRYKRSHRTGGTNLPHGHHRPLLEIPAVVGMDGITTDVKDGDLLIVDGQQGTVYSQSSAGSIRRVPAETRSASKERKADCSEKPPSQTRDGQELNLLANVGEPWELSKAVEYSADGIGLFRMEFLFMNKERLPSEDEQFEAYKEALQKMEGKPVTIRTLDIGGDKKLPTCPLSMS